MYKIISWIPLTSKVNYFQGLKFNGETVVLDQPNFLSDNSYLELRMSQKSKLRSYVINQVPKVFPEKKIEISLKLKGVQISYYMIKKGCNQSF